MNLRNLGVRLRNNKSVYTIYYHIGSLALKLLGYLTPYNQKRILFVSFGGLKYDDSPKEIYLAMLNDERFKNFEFVWAFIEPEKFTIPRGKKIRIDSIRYFQQALSAKAWITNSSVERGLSFKRKHNVYFNSWHGTPIKKMGCDLSSENQSFTSKACNSWDIQLAQSQYEADIFERVFDITKDKFKIIGLPRNDALANISDEEIKRIRQRLFIPNNKKVILYAPTFREYIKDENQNSALILPVDFSKWEKALGNEYVLLLRAHYDIVKDINIPHQGNFIIDVSSYHCLNDLMMVSDMLISDYSSIFFDFSILGRPMFCYAYDYEEYLTKRGLYFDIRDELSMKKDITESELLDEIKNINYNSRKKIAIDFRKKYVTEFGSASKKSVDILFNLISTDNGD